MLLSTTLSLAAAAAVINLWLMIRIGQLAGRVGRVKRSVLGPEGLPAQLDLVGQRGRVAERRDR